MKITAYTHEAELIKKYCDFLKEHYSEEWRINTHAETIKTLLEENHPFYQYGKSRNFLATSDDNVLGHCSAIIDSRNKHTGLIGFYDCNNDFEVSKKLLEAAIQWLKSNNCTSIEGPVNLTIWNDYRFIVTNKRSPEIFDPFNKEYYPKQWEEAGFACSGKYVSAIRSDFNHVLPYTKKSFESLKERGLRIRTFDSNNSVLELDRIRQLANNIFSDSWNFVKLSEQEFDAIYKHVLPLVNPEFIELVETENAELVGFCFSIPNPHNKNQIIMKSIGVLKEYQGKNVGAALLYSQHLKAEHAGYKEFYYPLIRVGNNVTKLPYEGYTVITEYETYKLTN